MPHWVHICHPPFQGVLSVTILFLACYLLGWAKVPRFCGWRNSLELWRFQIAIPPHGSAVFSGFTVDSTLELGHYSSILGQGSYCGFPCKAEVCILHHTGFQKPSIRKSLWLSSLAALLFPSPIVSILAALLVNRIRRPRCLHPCWPLHWRMDICRDFSLENVVSLTVSIVSLKHES